MALTFYRKAGLAPTRLGILPGTFNPPTRAHLALGRAALARLEEVVFVLPRALPHKEYSGVAFDQRMELLLSATIEEPRFSVAASDGGLFIDIVRECREAYGNRTVCVVLCGRDAAERLVSWDYGGSAMLPEMLREFEVLVASRGGPYRPPEYLRDRMDSLLLGDDCDLISASDVRERVVAGQPWEALVPPAIAARVKALYGRD